MVLNLPVYEKICLLSAEKDRVLVDLLVFGLSLKNLHLLSSGGSIRRTLRPCFELLWTNMLSENASKLPSNEGVDAMATWIIKAKLIPNSEKNQAECKYTPPLT